MKSLLRSFLINLGAILLTTQLVPGFILDGGIKTLGLASLIFMVINLLITPILRIMFLPLNLLTLGFFSWIVNVLALYLLVNIIPQLKIVPFYFPGANISGFMVPSMELGVLYVAILASLVIGVSSHFMQWLVK